MRLREGMASYSYPIRNLVPCPDTQIGDLFPNDPFPHTPLLESVVGNEGVTGELKPLPISYSDENLFDGFELIVRGAKESFSNLLSMTESPEVSRSNGGDRSVYLSEGKGIGISHSREGVGVFYDFRAINDGIRLMHPYAFGLGLDRKRVDQAFHKLLFASLFFEKDRSRCRFALSNMDLGESVTDEIELSSDGLRVTRIYYTDRTHYKAYYITAVISIYEEFYKTVGVNGLAGSIKKHEGLSPVEKHKGINKTNEQVIRFATSLQALQSRLPLVEFEYSA